MLGAPSDLLDARLGRVRDSLATLAVDGLLVSHLPNLAYLANFDGSAGVLAIAPEGVALATDGRYRLALESADPATACPGLSVLVGDGPPEISPLEFLSRSGARRVGFEAERLTVARYGRLQAAAAHAGLELVPVAGVVEAARIVKDPYELGLLEEAGRLLSAVAVGVLSDLRAGVYEHEVALAIEAGMRRAGFSRPAFDTIVASGPSSAMPHARAGRRRLEPGDLVVLDFGGVYGGYCVDLTRTARLEPVQPETEAMYAAVAAAQQAAIDAVRPGLAMTEVDAAARSVLEQRGYGEAFVHGTGHGLGLEVHEAPRLARPAPPDPGAPGVQTFGTPKELAPGMVFTIEPGAYVGGLGGVRVEDDVVVTPDGHAVLTSVAREWRIG